MGKYENIVQGAAEKLMEDERLRSNLADDEANVLINWAIEWLESSIVKAQDEAVARQIAQAELGRLRPAMQKINDLMADHKALVQMLTSQLAEAWRKG